MMMKKTVKDKNGKTLKLNDWVMFTQPNGFPCDAFVKKFNFVKGENAPNYCESVVIKGTNFKKILPPNELSLIDDWPKNMTIHEFIEVNGMEKI